MATALIVTVGGSHQPILTGIKQHRPDRVYFVCSADVDKQKGSYHQVIGEGKVLKSAFDLSAPDLPNIVTLAGLSEDRYCVRTVEGLDDLGACYRVSMEVIELARREMPGARVVVDYTGGTKSMTAGLVAAALDEGSCEVALVVGKRADLIKVVNRTEFVRRVPISEVQLMRRMRDARELARRFDFAAAEQLLRDTAAELAGPENQAELQRGIGLCRAFDCWDRFDHREALESLLPYQSGLVTQRRMLNALTGNEKGHGFEWVEDLLFNAERRAMQGRFDDAVGRIYRAVELTAQVWLKEKHGIETGDVDLQKAPEAVREKLARSREEREDGKPGKIKIALLQAWELITVFGEDPVAAKYVPLRNRLKSFLSVRNASLFAHGFTPVTEVEYRQYVPEVMGWLRECVEVGIKALQRKRVVQAEQFPADLLRPVQ